MGTYSMAIDKDNILYTTQQDNKFIYAYNLSEMQEQESLASTRTFSLSSKVYGMVIVDNNWNPY